MAVHRHMRLSVRQSDDYLYVWNGDCYYMYEDDCHYVLQAINAWRPGRYRQYRIPAWLWEGLTVVQQTEVIDMFVAGSKPDSNGHPKVWEGKDVKWVEKHPAINEYLTVISYGDGSPRQPATINFFVGREGYTLVLQDRDVGRSLWASAGTVEQAWRILEQQAQKGEEAPWRTDKRDTGKTGRFERRPG